MIGIKTKVTERGPGISKLVERLGGLGHLTLGVMDKKAAEPHSTSDLMVGEVAAIWELGLAPNGPRRSWLSSWIDANQDRMIREARVVFQEILQGKLSRKRGFEKLGLQWAMEVRENLSGGKVTPPLKAATIKLKGHAIPLVDSWDLHNAIGYKVFLPHWKNVPGGSASGAARHALAKTMPSSAIEVKGSPQPPDKGAGKVAKRLKLGLATTILAPVRSKKAKGGPKGVKAKRVSKTKASSVLTYARAARKSTWALKWLKKLAKKMVRGSGSGDGRNHGYKGSSHYGRTGRAGRRK